jgi:phosphoenolpyruvate synthase/pyruvate phosphate dikinase
MTILWLGDAVCHVQGRVGGKAAYLSQLAAAAVVGHAVPPGFCLIQQCDDDPLGELGEAYAALAARCGIADPPVAVRSSALDEDGALTSFAGQHDTYLNVTGLAAVAAAVAACRASAHAPRALAYRQAQGLDKVVEDGRLVVLVQQLVVADVAAVLFSANPVSGDTGEVVITASWGLGESIVGGTVTPDTYHLRKRDLAVTVRQVAEKRRMTVVVPAGVREVVVPRLLAHQPVLDERQIAELGRLALLLERHFGWPVDVECAYAGGRLYLLQCRPITTLRTAPSAPASVDGLSEAGFTVPQTGEMTSAVVYQARA